jgi:cell division protein FtsB
MRIFVVILGLAVVLLQYRLWVSEQGIHEVARLQGAIDDADAGQPRAA